MHCNLDMTPGPGSRTPISAPAQLWARNKLLEISAAQVASVRSRPSFDRGSSQSLGWPAILQSSCHWANGPIHEHMVYSHVAGDHPICGN